MKRFTLLVAGLLASGLALAQHGRPMAERYPDDPRYGYQEEGVIYDFARVIDAKPVYDEVGIAEPREVCWNEPVTYYERDYAYYRPRREAPEVLGGIIGGLIGNQFGSGDGRVAATIAGVALGSAVARDAERYDRRYGGASYARTVHERRCDVREDYRTERQLVGYEVTYDYNGSIGRAFSERHPGTEMRVRVMVEPAED